MTHLWALDRIKIMGHALAPINRIIPLNMYQLEPILFDSVRVPTITTDLCNNVVHMIYVVISSYPLRVVPKSARWV